MVVEVGGLVLNILDGIVIALPDFPLVKEYMTPPSLREIISRLENDEIVEEGDRGYQSLLNVVDNVVVKLDRPSDCVAVSLGSTPYGNPMIKGQFESDSVDFPRNELVEWIVFK